MLLQALSWDQDTFSYCLIVDRYRLLQLLIVQGGFLGVFFPRGMDPIHVKVYVCFAFVQQMCASVYVPVCESEREGKIKVFHSSKR